MSDHDATDHREALVSGAGVPDTVGAICERAQAAGMAVFARVDHAGGAREAGLELADEVVILLGAPQVGTALMQADPRAGLDLPLRVLVWDDRGTTRVAWWDPHRLARDYALEDLTPVLDKMAAGLRAVLTQAVA